MSDDFEQRGGSPWGSPRGGGGGNGSGRGPTPPDFDKIIREIQDKIKKFLSGGTSSGGKPIILGIIILGFIWWASGLY
jgi:Bacterial membrane protein N terminal.